jgi:hypothetical protein
MLFLIGQAILKLDTQKLHYLCFVTFGNASVFSNVLEKSAGVPIYLCKVCGILQNSEILFLKLKMFIVPYENILKSLTCYATFV